MFTVGVRAALEVSGGLRGWVPTSEARVAEGTSAGVVTYEVTARLQSEELDPDGSVFDVNVLRDRLGDTLLELELAALGDDAQRPPTGEVLARHLHRRLSHKLPVIAGFPLIRRGTLTVSLEDPRGSFASFAAPVRSAPSAGRR